MAKLKSLELARMIDISAVRAESTLSEVNQIVEAAKKHHFICVFSMPSMLPYVFEGLQGMKDVGIGGIVGFPSGGDTTESKVWQANDLKERGCNEIDMVMNIGKLKSGLYNDVVEEIRCIKAAVSPLPLKVIIEVALLTDEEVTKAAALVLEGGVDTGEINPRTMESKLVPGLFFAGEIVNCDAYTGGFNLQIAWSTGRLAGMS